MHWRRLRPGELDHELLWLAVSVTAALLAWLWLRTGAPTPRCVWHDVTGLACLSCGGTRCVRYLLRGAWEAAFLVNPLIFTTLVLGVVYDLYAAVVVLGRLPRLRFGPTGPWLGWAVRIIVVAVVLSNWAWLIYRRV